MATQMNRRWLLAQRPRGIPTADDFEWSEVPLPEPREGEVLVRNLCLACEPTQLGWAAGETYLPAVPIGDVMRSIAAAEVVASRDPSFRVGDRVQGMFGWQDFAVVRAEAAGAAGEYKTYGSYPVLPIAPEVSAEHALSALGNTGLTAYFGMLEIGRPRAGETVLVSAAAGATGSIAGQIAKIMGCRVVGIAGGAEKCRTLTEELGFTAAIDYKRENLMTRLRQTCPQGVDVYFDNVGGRTLDAVLLHLALHGRVVLCGAIAGYVDPTPGPRNYLRLLRQRGRMEGFIVLDFLQRAAEATAQLRAWFDAGLLKDRLDVQEGLERAPHALARLFKGENQGKQLVRIAPG